jgi:hypothetical protein
MSTTTTTPPQPPADPAPAKSRRRSTKEKPAKASAGKPPRTGVASVNLLSPWVFEELRVHQLRRRFLFGGAVLLAVIALVWCALQFNLHRANADLRGEEAVGAGLTRELRELAPVRTYVNSVERRVVTVKGATYDDVAFSKVLAALDAATPNGATIGSISVELAAAEKDTSDDKAKDSKAAEKDPARGLVGTTCPGPDPFGTRVVVGCVTIEGTAVSRDAVSGLVIALGADKLFVEPFVDTTTTEDSDAVTFSGSVGISPTAFSGRYDSLGDELSKGAKK